MLEIKTGLFLGLSINGMDYPLEKNGFQKLVMVSNRRMSTATFELVFSDLTDWINKKITLADGVPIVIKLGRSIDRYDVYKYRVWNYKRDPSRTVPQYTVYGYFDAPKWFLEAWKKPINGTSSSALSELASKCGLTPECDPSNDNMLWLPGNERACMFARSIAERGWMDANGCMVIGMTLDGRFLYKNLTNLPRTGPIFTTGNVPGTANVIDNRYLTNSGYGNATGGYKHALRQQNIDGKRDSWNEVNVQRKTQQFQLNKDVRGMLKKGRIDFGPVDGGNTHRYFHRALYTNMRSALLYSQGVELMIDQRTPLKFDLFEPFIYEAYDPPATGEPRLTEQFRSVYYVTAKAIYIEQGNYWEKFQGYTTGVNKDPDGKGSQL